MENLYGRILTKSEIEEIPEKIQTMKGMEEISKSKVFCNRCGSTHQKSQVKLPVGAYYCPTCINIGRVRSDEFLYFLPQQDFVGQDFLVWAGKLTKYQQEISDGLIKAVHEQTHILVHAVTGAGKTEMIYQAINEVLKTGGSVAIASPRVDVCIELYQRISKDFKLKVALLHGNSEPYFRSPLIISTTHQLLRFRQAFDLLIIDEVDAFPFVDDEMLYFASEHSRKSNSTLIYLTATSTEKLNRQVKSGKLNKLSLAQRFHGNPLVLPKPIWQNQFIKQMTRQRKTGFPLLIFVAEIEQGEKLAYRLQKDFPLERIGFVASTTESRLRLVEQFRAQELTILVTTTILERGVTFPKVDVFVYHAEHFNFTSSALIQIAGRVGRSPERPTGLVYFFHKGRTKAINRSITEIQAMNKLGGFS